MMGWPARPTTARQSRKRAALRSRIDSSTLVGQLLAYGAGGLASTSAGPLYVNRVVLTLEELSADPSQNISRMH